MKKFIIGFLLGVILTVAGRYIPQFIHSVKKAERAEIQPVKVLYPKTSSITRCQMGDHPLISTGWSDTRFTFIDYPNNDDNKTYRLLFRLTYCGSTDTDDLYQVTKSSVPELKDNEIIRFSGGTKIILKTGATTCSLSTESPSTLVAPTQ